MWFCYLESQFRNEMNNTRKEEGEVTCEEVKRKQKEEERGVGSYSSNRREDDDG